MDINWQEVAQIKEIKEYFEDDFEGFQNRIQYHIRALQSIEEAELDKLATLRILEVTNGCIQWAFRRQDEECLSVEQTRECMNQVIGFIKEKRIDFPSGKSLNFTPAIEALIDEGKDLYRAAFKKNVEGAQREYYAYSTAQFLVYGRARLNTVMQLVREEFEPLFTSYYIEKGERYIAHYLNGLPHGD